MVKITEQLIRKKSEHNELIISTLEELSLHQEDIEQIEHIQNWCSHLKILLLQNNLIVKIENLQKLKHLEYLNLAINNIERIENLERCESLSKLDLTLNFIGELTSVENLKDNIHLRLLILTGNPCTDFDGYRDYVITVLPQLESLDCDEIKRTERLVALKNFNEIRRRISQQEAKYKIDRDEQKIRVAKQLEIQYEECKGLTEDERLKRFWDQKTEHCPEIRFEISKNQRKSKNLSPNENSLIENHKKPQRSLFAKDGRPYSVNEPKLEFNFMDEIDRYELDLHVYKFLDTSLIEIDVQTNYVRITVKGKIFQMAFNDEIKSTETKSQRSTITGHLLIVMPKLNYNEAQVFPNQTMVMKNQNQPKILDKSIELKGTVDYKNIVRNKDIIDESEIPELI